MGGATAYLGGATANLGSATTYLGGTTAYLVGYDKNNATLWLHLARFSARLRIQDGAECGNNRSYAA